MSSPSLGRLRDRILALLIERGDGKSICPSEVARAMVPEAWRPLMEPVRAAARSLVADGAILVTQGGQVVDPDVPVKGPTRLRLARSPVQRGPRR